MNCQPRTLHDFITSLLSMSSLSNKYINPISANILPKSNVPAILQPIEKPAT